MNHQMASQAKTISSSIEKSLNLMTKKTALAPFVLSENEKGYNLFLILPGIARKNVFVDVDKNKNEISVYVTKKDQHRHDAAFWVFTVPKDGLLNRLTTGYGLSGLEISIPKISALLAA